MARLELPNQLSSQNLTFFSSPTFHRYPNFAAFAAHMKPLKNWEAPPWSVSTVQANHRCFSWLIENIPVQIREIYSDKRVSCTARRQRGSVRWSGWTALKPGRGDGWVGSRFVQELLLLWSRQASVRCCAWQLREGRLPGGAVVPWGKWRTPYHALFIAGAACLRTWICNARRMEEVSDELHLQKWKMLVQSILQRFRHHQLGHEMNQFLHESSLFRHQSTRYDELSTLLHATGGLFSQKSCCIYRLQHDIFRHLWVGQSELRTSRSLTTLWCTFTCHTTYIYLLHRNINRN